MLQVDNVQAGADIFGATFSANYQSQPGTIFINGVLSPASGGQNGPAVRIFTIGFTALAGKGTTDISGTVVQVTAIDAVTAIGPATPRALVAGAATFDPDCSGNVFGDANDNCTFGAEDPLFTQKYLAGQETPTAEQLKKMDSYPDGSVSVADALYESQVLARLTHFAELKVASPTATGGIADLLVTVTDRDQVRVTSDLRVLAEAKVDTGFSTLTFDKPLGVGEDPNTKLGEATHEGDGVYRVQILGLNDPTTVYVTVLLSTLDPTDATIIKTIAIIGSAENQGTFSAWTSFGVPLGGSNQCFADSDCAAGFYCDDTAGPAHRFRRSSASRRKRMVRRVLRRRRAWRTTARTVSAARPVIAATWRPLVRRPTRSQRPVRTQRSVRVTVRILRVRRLSVRRCL